MNHTSERRVEQRNFRNFLQPAFEAIESVEDIPLTLAQYLRKAEVPYEIKHKGYAVLRQWVDYQLSHPFDYDDPFAVRYHVANFAAETSGIHQEAVELCSVGIDGLADVNGYSLRDAISTITDPKIMQDQSIAVIGGTARLALKMLAGVDVQSELPISDVDAVISTDVDVRSYAEAYGVDLAGAKIVDGDIRSLLPTMLANFDCTMNQVALYNGTLYYTQQALDDIKDGKIRLIVKNDPLFGSEGMVMPNGNVYINKTGFYRGLSFLFRGKGKELVVSQENIDNEATEIGRYWLVMFHVKIMPMKDCEARKRAITAWYETAHKMGATNTANPDEFFDELMELFPDTRLGSKDEKEFNAHSQARWIIGKLVSASIARIYGNEQIVLPETYTPANITL